MKLRFSLLVILLIICFSHNSDARHRQRGGKSLHRSKRTIGDIINWKLNLIQSILGGIGGIFGGGKSPRPSYGPRPQRPSYGSRPQKPSYGNPRPSRPRPRPRPQPQPRPSGYNGRPQRPGGASRPAGRPQFGPSNAIKMLKAPNLATAAPPSSAAGGYQSTSLGAPALDTGLTSPQSPDTYGSPQAPPVSSPTNTDSYGSPQAAPISSVGSPRAPVSPPAPPPSTNTYSSPGSSILAPQSQYGSGATNTFSSGSDPVIVDNSVAFSPSAQDTYSVAKPSPPAPAPAADSYGGAQFPVLAPASDTASLAQPSDPVILTPEIKEAPAPAADSYGGAQFPVLAPAPEVDTSSQAEPVVLVPAVVATTARSLTVDYSYDDYDPSDVPPDQAAELPSYGISSTLAPEGLETYGVASNSGSLSDDYDPSDVPADQAAVVVELQPQPTYGGDTRDVYGSAVAPVGTSAPVPDGAFTGDYPASQDTVIDLTDDVEDYQDYQASLAAGNEVVDESSGLLPPVEEDEDYQEAPVTPTSSPVLFTYAPSEGSTVDDLIPQLNIVVQSPEAGGSLRDPLNVIPDQYEDYEYEDEEDEDILSNYIELREELEQYSAQDIENDPTPTPAFDDLRGIQFTTRPPLPPAQDPEPTTYRAPIDFDLGTTAATGIEVDDVVLLKTEDYEDYDDSLANDVDVLAYSDEYETEDETDYEPGSENIPIVLEGGASQQAEALPSYDPVVLLVGTPEKSDSDTEEEIPLYENDLDERVQSKRKTQAKKGSSKLKDLYNNWYGPRNDWSRKIAKVQGRIRFKKLQAQKQSS